jgi:hypothetical protein
MVDLLYSGLVLEFDCRWFLEESGGQFYDRQRKLGEDAEVTPDSGSLTEHALQRNAFDSQDILVRTTQSPLGIDPSAGRC